MHSIYFPDPNLSWDNDKSRSESESFNNNDRTDEGKAITFTTKSSGKEKNSLQCKICHKKFNEITYLRSHMVTHSTLKPHKCSMCEKSFTRRRELLRHENVHTGFKPFKCPTCSKAFSRKDKLARHEKIHNGVKKFACRICPSVSFTKVEELLLHHRSAHSDDQLNGSKSKSSFSDQFGHRFQCETCSMQFSSSKIFEEHVKSHEVQNHSSQNKPNGYEYDSEDLNSDEENYTISSLKQLNSNPAITVTSISKPAG